MMMMMTNAAMTATTPTLIIIITRHRLFCRHWGLALNRMMAARLLGCLLACCTLTNEKSALVEELVRGNFEVEGSRTLANATRGVIVRAVARAEEASGIVTSTGDGHATKVRANANHDEPLLVLDTGSIGLVVAELSLVVLLGRGNLGVSAVLNEDGLATPLDGGVSTLRETGDVDLNAGKGEHICGGRHLSDELHDGSTGNAGVNSLGGANG